MHYLLDCIQYAQEQHILSNALQHKADSLSYLLNSEKAISPLMRYINSSGHFKPIFSEIIDKHKRATDAHITLNGIREWIPCNKMYDDKTPRPEGRAHAGWTAKVEIRRKEKRTKDWHTINMSARSQEDATYPPKSNSTNNSHHLFPLYEISVSFCPTSSWWSMCSTKNIQIAHTYLC